MSLRGWPGATGHLEIPSGFVERAAGVDQYDEHGSSGKAATTLPRAARLGDGLHDCRLSPSSRSWASLRRLQLREGPKTSQQAGEVLEIGRPGVLENLSQDSTYDSDLTRGSGASHGSRSARRAAPRSKAASTQIRMTPRSKSVWARRRS